MPNFFRRMFRYSNAYANKKFDEKADPAIQIQQAIEDAKKRHVQLTEQAGVVLGNRHRLAARLGSKLDEIDQLKRSTAEAIVLADKARSGGDTTKAAEYEQAAMAFAGQLVAGESAVEDLKTLHEQAQQASEQARQAVADNEFRLRQSMAEQSKLMTQLESAKMQEKMNDALATMSDLAPQGDTPTLGEIRSKIEERYGAALGHSELMGGGVEARMIEVRKASIDAAAANRLDAIRASIGRGQIPPSLEKGATPDAIESGQDSAPGVPEVKGQEATPPA